MFVVKYKEILAYEEYGREDDEEWNEEKYSIASHDWREAKRNRILPILLAENYLTLLKCCARHYVTVQDLLLGEVLR